LSFGESAFCFRLVGLQSIELQVEVDLVGPAYPTTSSTISSGMSPEEITKQYDTITSGFTPAKNGTAPGEF